MATGARSATKWRDQTIIGLLEKLSRERELHPEECALMERTVRRLKPKRSIWRWSEKEDRLLSEFIKRRAGTGNPRPFQPNDEIRDLARSLNRSYETTHKRIQHLRKAMKLGAVNKYVTRPSVRREVEKRERRSRGVAPEGFATIREAAEILNISEYWLAGKRRLGGGPKYIKVGQDVFYDLEILRRFPIQQILDEGKSNRAKLKYAVQQMTREYEKEIGVNFPNAAKRPKA